MDKEQVLKIQTLTKEQRNAAERYFTTMERMRKPQVIDGSVTQVKAQLDKLAESYNKRKAKQQEQREKLEQEKALHHELIEAYNKCTKYDITHNEVIEAIINLYRDRYNAKIQQQIDELQRQML